VLFYQVFNINSNITDMNTKIKQSIKTISTKILVSKALTNFITKIFVSIVLMLCLVLVFISKMFELKLINLLIFIIDFCRLLKREDSCRVNNNIYIIFIIDGMVVGVFEESFFRDLA